MKTKNRSYRGAGFSLVEIMVVIAIIALLAAFVMPQKAGAQVLAAQGQYIDGTTNRTILAGGNATPANVVPANTINFFNLSGINGSQANTNLWPTLQFTLGRGEGTPARWIAVGANFNAGASDANVLEIKFAESTDGAHWLTNSLITWDITANGTTPVAQGTNIDTGGYPFLAVYSVSNVLGSTFITNLWLGPGQKREQ